MPESTFLNLVFRRRFEMQREQREKRIGLIKHRAKMKGEKNKAFRKTFIKAFAKATKTRVDGTFLSFRRDFTAYSGKLIFSWRALVW